MAPVTNKICGVDTKTKGGFRNGTMSSIKICDEDTKDDTLQNEEDIQCDESPSDEEIESVESQDEVNQCDDSQSDEVNDWLSNLRAAGDLSVIGRMWIRVLQAGLVGAKFGFIPVVYAAKQPEPPKKPPKMKYEDLPIYQSPHHEYKEYVDSLDKCPDRNTKIIHRALLPYVRLLHIKAADAYCAVCCNVVCNGRRLCTSIQQTKNEFKQTMRHPDNLLLRQGVVAGGTLAGYLIGGGGGIPRRLFFTSAGALAAGALCFPQETDEHFRTVVYNVAAAAVTCYNFTCRKNIALRERLPCKDDLPPEPKDRKPLCPRK